MLLGSHEHLQAIQKKTNENQEYLDMCKGDGNKSFTFILEAEPEKKVMSSITIGYTEEDGVIQEIWEGLRDTQFVISGPYGNWVRILRMELGVTKALTMRKIKLKKGSLVKLLRSSDSTVKWIQILVSIPVQFHGDYVAQSTNKG